MNNKTSNMPYHIPAILNLAVSLTLLGACSNTDNDVEDFIPDGETAIVGTVASDFGSGAHALIGTTAPFAFSEGLAETVSDFTVDARGSNFYRTEGFKHDSITRFELSNPSVPVTQFTTMDEGEAGSSNPQRLVFESDSKAYVMRYGKTKAWIVNPLATEEAEFKTGEIDLSDYDPGDGSVEMVDGVITNGKLFIVMQRFDESFTAQDAYVAVINTTTNTEINTETGVANKGILLPIKNPNDIQLDDNGEIYISASGSAYSTPPQYTGGIITLDSETYEVSLLIDDGDAGNHPFDNITDVEVVSADKGYFISYKGIQDTSLYAFNPITGVVDETPVDGLTGLNLSGLASDSSDRLWVSISSSVTRAAGVRVYNTDDNSLIDEEISLILDPKAIVFGTTAN